MRPRTIIPIIIALTIVAGFFVYPPLANRFNLDVFSQRAYKLGLDLRGGTHLVYQADVSEITPSERGEALDGLKNVIEARVNQFGVAEPNITVNKNANRLIAELAGVLDVNEAIRLIGETPFLEFKELSTTATTTGGHLGGGLTPNDFRTTELTGRFLEGASFSLSPLTGEPVVFLNFNSEGADLFEDITARNVGLPLAIFLDGRAIIDSDGDGVIGEDEVYAPIVQQTITGGQATITGNPSTFIENGQRLAQNLDAGALPIPIELISQTTVGPSLGAQSLERSLFAGLIGFLAVAIYMIAYYRLAGLIAIVSLGIYVLLTLSLFKLIGVTLTLAGVVGFILTIGMAVDANILIFERLKEELRQGREFRIAVEEAFNHAWTAIRDANISTIMTATVLFVFTTSLIKGFALTLGVGLVISLIVAMVITRAFMRALAGTSLATKMIFWRT